MDNTSNNLGKDKLILVVDDDKLDTKVLLKGLKEVDFQCDARVVRNGKEALEYLLNKDNKRPCLIFLDINMPIMNGIEFLHERYTNKTLLSIPTIVFTTSKKKEDKSDCYSEGISGYIIKQNDYSEFKESLKILKEYWELNELVDVC